MANMNSILVVEDSPEYLLFLKKVLKSEFLVETASSYKQAFDLLSKQKFDLFILDINLGDESGFDLGRIICSHELNQNSPVLYLTSRNSIVDKVTGFSLGADDYIVKPVDELELLARVKAILRRTVKNKIQEELYEFGGVTLNWSAQRVYIQENANSVEIFLTVTERRILRELMVNIGRVVLRERILDVAWGDSVSVVDRNVDAHIYSVRKKLKKYSGYIKTVSGMGYRFVYEN